MKKIKIFSLALLLLSGWMTSCEQFLGGINVNPNNPTVATPAILLPSIEARLAYVMGGDASRYLSIYTQHVDGAGRQFAVIQDYGIATTDVNTMWGTNLYAGVLTDVLELKKLSETDGLNHYLGAAQVLEAYALLFITDTWGDAPYTDALQGVDNLQPGFDTQDQLYNTVFTLLTSAKGNLSSADGGSQVPGGDDFIFGGSTASWIQFANFIEARANLHWSKTGGTSSLDAAISALGGSFTANAEGAYFPFSTAPTETAPWYQYNEQRRDIAIGDSYVDLMNSLNDPRVAIYGAVLDNDHPLFIRARNYPLGTYKEVQFMLAEANFQKGEQAAAYTAYINAITADFQELEGLGLLTSADLDTYIGQAEVDPGEANLTLEDIMTQKYIAMFADPEVFVDWRRTGIPTLTPNSGAQVPRRLPYPEQEILFNSNTPTQLTIYDRVTWDN